MATWNKQCSHCNEVLLSMELNTYCCNWGKQLSPCSHPLPHCLSQSLTIPLMQRQSQLTPTLWTITSCSLALESQTNSLISLTMKPLLQFASLAKHIIWYEMPNSSIILSIGFYMMREIGNVKQKHLVFTLQSCRQSTLDFSLSTLTVVSYWTLKFYNKQRLCHCSPL